MTKLNIPKNRIRKLKTYGLGDYSYEFEKFNFEGNGKLIDLCSNDYFGLSRDKDIIKAAYKISLSEGLGAGSSRFISGSRPIHNALEKEIGEWLNQEKVLLFPSGFQANIAAIQALADRDTIVIADKFIHNSLLTGVKVSGAKLIRFRHNDINDLENKISKFDKNNHSLLVIVESLYSMEGSLAPLKEIVEICKNYKAKLFVDEAHALGIIGKNGRGLSNDYKNSINIISGTFGKSFGSGGAFLACNEIVSHKIIQNSGAFRYTTALAPALAAAALLSLKKIKENENWGSELLNFSKRWKKEILNLGNFNVRGECQILSIIIGKEDETLLMQKYLEENGFLAIAIRPPTVPIGQSRIRITIKRSLNNMILEKFISVLKAYK